MKISDVIMRARKILDKYDADAWVVYGYAKQNPIFYDIVGHDILCSRPAFLVIPKKTDAEAGIICSAIEEAMYRGRVKNIIVYKTRDEMLSALREHVGCFGSAMMEYSKDQEIPSVSYVDAGLGDLVRGLGVKMMSSSEILQVLFSTWGKDGFASHRRASADLCDFICKAFLSIRDGLDSGITEYDVNRYLLKMFDDKNYYYEYEPVVAAGPNSGNVHYYVKENGSARISNGDIVMIDAHIREKDDDAIFSDITLMGYVGEKVPERFAEIFDVVAEARELGCTFIERHLAQAESIPGYEVDEAVRRHIVDAGFGDYFIHRTGHSIDTKGHGRGVNLDSYEIKDTRELIDDIGFSIEPGIYFKEFGVRSEINCYIKDGKLIVTTPRQSTIIPICSDNYAKCIKMD